MGRADDFLLTRDERPSVRMRKHYGAFEILRTFLSEYLVADVVHQPRKPGVIGGYLAGCQRFARLRRQLSMSLQVLRIDLSQQHGRHLPFSKYFGRHDEVANRREAQIRDRILDAHDGFAQPEK